MLVVVGLLLRDEAVVLLHQRVDLVAHLRQRVALQLHLTGGDDRAGLHPVPPCPEPDEPVESDVTPLCAADGASSCTLSDPESLDDEPPPVAPQPARVPATSTATAAHVPAGTSRPPRPRIAPILLVTPVMSDRRPM